MNMVCATIFAQTTAEYRPDIYDPDDEAWERVYHTADKDAQHATHYNRRNAAHTATKTNKQMDCPRVGCICMDGIAQRRTERGACGGHKGVRFWVYERTNGDTLLNATERHLLHPEPLAADAPIVFGTTHSHWLIVNSYWLMDTLYVLMFILAAFLFVKKKH